MNTTQDCLSQSTELYRPIPREELLALLGAFHRLCLIVIVVSLSGSRWLGGWIMPAIIANALVAIAITAPLSGGKPSLKWRSSWLLLLFIGYLAVSMLVRGINPSASIFYPDYKFLDLRYRDIVLALACLHATSWFVADFQWTKWRGWPVVLLLVVACGWNVKLLNLPCCILVCVGCYTAFASLGRLWLWRSVVASVFIMIPHYLWASKTLLQTAVTYNDFNNRPILCADAYNGLYGSSTHCMYAWIVFLPLTVAVLQSYRGSNLRPHAWARMVLILGLALQLLAILFTVSRTAYTAVLLMIPIGLVLSGRLRVRVAWLPVVVSLAIIILLSARGYLTVGQVFGVQNHQLLIAGRALGFLLVAAAVFQQLLARVSILAKEKRGTMRLLILALGTQILSLAFSTVPFGEAFSSPEWILPSAAMISGLFGVLWTESEQPRSVSQPEKTSDTYGQEMLFNPEGGMSAT